ncbi:MAG: hypothetical protein IIC96_11415 [Chloroflexi bacterium]|nr:hypothetical protein [Chloroflexota bacterium]
MTMFRFTIGFGLLFGLMAFGTLTAALVSAHGSEPKKVQICHVPPGNPANAQLISISHHAVAAHVAHGDNSPPNLAPCVPLVDQIIDADGTLSAGDGIPGAVEVSLGDPLASFPVTGSVFSGLDWFDNDADGQWTFGAGGDDLHSEDPSTCPGAIRDGLHQLGQDCIVLDLDGSLFTGQRVDCDLEVNFPFTEPHLTNDGCPSSINDIRYHDANNNGSWDDGEDIVLDTNGDSFFN